MRRLDCELCAVYHTGFGQIKSIFVEEDFTHSCVLWFRLLVVAQSVGEQVVVCSRGFGPRLVQANQAPPPPSQGR